MLAATDRDFQANQPKRSPPRGRPIQKKPGSPIECICDNQNIPACPIMINVGFQPALRQNPIRNPRKTGSSRIAAFPIPLANIKRRYAREYPVGSDSVVLAEASTIISTRDRKAQLSNKVMIMAIQPGMMMLVGKKV